MPVTVSVDHEQHLVRFTLAGALSDGEVADALRDAASRMRPGERYDVFSDHSALEVPATPTQVELVLSELARPASPFRGARVAMAVSSTASYGMMRMLGAYASEHEVDVMAFGDVASARAWLDARRAEDGRVS